MGVNDLEEQGDTPKHVDLREELLKVLEERSTTIDPETVQLIARLYDTMETIADPLDPQSPAREVEKVLDLWLTRQMRLLANHG